MKINDRNKWISIVSKGQAPGDGGAVVETEVKIFEGWAAIWPVRAKEARENMRTGATVTHNIRILFRSGIEHNQRIYYGSRVFEIKGIINPEEVSIFLDLVCEEKF